MLKNAGQNLAIAVLILGILSGCTRGRTPAGPSNDAPSLPAPAALTSEETPWQSVESAISQAAIGVKEGKCEWEVWGWWEKERYIWAFCQSGEEINAILSSGPRLVQLTSDGDVESVVKPRDGSLYLVDIRKLFPPAVQAKILNHEFDTKGAQAHLIERWQDPSLGPSIYLRTGKTLPVTGEAETPAISARSIDRIEPISTLGMGRIDRLEALPDGKWLGNGPRGITLFEGNPLAITSPYLDIIEDGQGVLSSDGSLLAIWSKDQVQIRRVEEGSVIQEFQTALPGGRVVDVSFQMGQTVLAAEVRPPGEEIYSHQVELYDINDGALLNSWDMQGMGMLFSPDSQMMISRFAMTGINLWSIPEGRRLQSFRTVVGAAAFSPDGTLLAVSDMGKLRVFQIPDGKELVHLQVDSSPVSGVAFSPDGQKILTWSDESHPARLWSVADGTPLIDFDVQGVTAGAFSSRGDEVGLAGNGEIGIYSSASGDKTGGLDGTYPGIADISFAKEITTDGVTNLAVLYGLNTTNKLMVNWNIPLGTSRFLKHTSSAITLAFTREPYGIAVGTWEGSIQMISPVDGSLMKTFTGLSAQVQDLKKGFWDTLAASSMGEVRIYGINDPDGSTGRRIPVSDGWVRSLAWTCSLAASSTDGTISVMDEIKYNEIARLETEDDDIPVILAYSPDCEQLIAVKNMTIYRWKTESWETLPVWSISTMITSLAISPDGTLLAVGSTDGGVRLLSNENGILLRTLEGHAGTVTALEFSHDGRYLASGGEDGVLILWGVK